MNEITDSDFLGYRGTLFYDLCKISAIRLAYADLAALKCLLSGHR